MGPRDRTQTAVKSPLSSAELSDIAVLLVQGSALGPGLSTPRRLIRVHDGLEVGRSSGVAPDVDGDGVVASWLVADPLISATHARIARAGDRAFELSDVSSKNGTFVDGVRVDSATPTRLRNGAVIFFGNHSAVFRMVSAIELECIEGELRAPLGPVATASPTLAVACDRLRRLAAANGELLLLGETGVGKEIYARAVHARSGRRGRFVPINCGAIPRELVESELFGYRQGAHSTAHAAKTGLIEEAEGGTLFLDEIGEMPQEAQIKLLRFLQDRELTPLGSTRPRKIDVRVVAATNRTANSGKAPAGLREDVVGRLGAAPIHLPPLRDRMEDLGVLVGHFLRAASFNMFDLPTFRALALYDWPLNVRELEKIVTTAAVLSGGQRAISLRDLPEAMTAPTPAPRRGAAAEAEVAAAAASVGSVALPASAVPSRSPPTLKTTAGPSPTPSPAQIEELLRRYNGNVADVSRELGKHRAAVWRWMKKWGIGVEKFRRPD